MSWQNLANLSAPPLWSTMFSRVRTNVPAGTSYLMASPDLSQDPDASGFVSRLWNGREYVAYPQPMNRRQGAFDNIHIAPPMKAPRSIRERFGKPGFHLDSIAMAPFCIHDCLHMHWRWLPTGDKEKHLWGWSAAGPYTARGEPHIHEGLAHGNSAASETLAQWMQLGLRMLDEWPMPAGKSWAMFYWVLRYCRSGDTVRERLLEEGAPVP
ncbi:hypothetical protein HMI49_32755 [Corallococcus exercitus]|uniref:Uncharacterized protein n=1 Tax=Corallococcus exercitus TaxID=2316736 RepID=A0A7Y4KQ69_9BACT|nr:hypothetical protein [Corallococcus exercitus]NOK37983.1 hypothetical protein [Corallococcus exercitus]